eukprot:TRINITY_DN61176_c0_g1_i1.p1 TRINITY_DN61176_c0_g1~~TRINITY_DN61176_c0_g1_i1.p1  ORF type:complete len:446 (+),score=76.18 TRINITY_DN61176_c0_g1_i1:74-1411(+)
MARDLENKTPNTCFGRRREQGAPRCARRLAKHGAVRLAATGLQDAETVARVSDDVRQAVSGKVDAEVQDKLRQVWGSCSMIAKQVYHRHKQSNENISKSIANLTSSQDALAGEYRNLRHVVSSMADFLSTLNSGLPSGRESSIAECASADSCSTASTCATPRCDWSQVGYGGPGLQAADLAPSSVLGHESHVEQTPAPHQETLETVDVVLNYLSTGSKKKKAQPKLASKQPAAALFLAAALGFDSPQKELRLAPISEPSQNADSACEPGEAVDAYVFALTLRVAETFELGLSLSPYSSALRIQSVLPHGAVEAWNQQCENNRAPERMLKFGDQIVRVNDVAGDTWAMTDECQHRKLLKIQVLRTAGHDTAKEEKGVPAASALMQPPVSTSFLSPKSISACASPNPAWPTPFADGGYYSFPSLTQPPSFSGSCFGGLPLITVPGVP